jgi:diguanylate cyclase (GGDEF)-like protein
MSDTHRHFARLKTREMANLSFSNGEHVACEIHDFSQRGLHLQPLDRAITSAIKAKHARDETVVIEFRAGTSNKTHALQGRLTHTTANDFGLYLFDDMSKDAFQDLVQARARMSQGSTGTSDLFPEESQAILRDSVNLFRLFLGQVWQGLLDKIMVKIADRDTAHLPLTDQSRYLNSLTDLQIRIDEISRRHFDILIERMQKIGEVQEAVPTLSSDELSIIDDGSFEDSLSISNVFNRIEADNRSAMHQFAERFSRLMPVHIAHHNDPFGPQSVCLTFQETIRTLDFNNPMRAILYRQFGEVLEEHYATLYEQLNRLLMPLKPIREQAPTKTAQPNRLPDAGMDNLDNSSVVAEPEPQADTVSTQVSKLAEIAEKLFALYPPMGATPAAAMPPPTTGSGANRPAPATVAGPAYGETSANAQDISGQLQQLLQVLGRFSEGQSGSASVGHPPQQTDAASASAGNVTLSQIESLLAQHSPVQDVSQPSSLSDRVSRLLAAPEYASQVPAPQREELGTTANLLSHAMAEFRSNSDIDLLLKKLEKPIYDFALRGDAPSRLENHPLGLLINLVDRFAIVADDDGHFHDSQFRELVDSIIDKGISQQDDDGGSLETTCAALEKLLKYPTAARKQRVASYQEICEARGRIRYCNQFIAEELNRRFSGRTTPRIITRLLELGWRHRLVLAKLRDDKAELDQSWQILSSLQANAEPASGHEAGKTNTALLDSIETGLGMIVMKDNQLDELMQELTAYLQVPGQAERVKLPQNWFRLPDTVSDATQPQNEALPGKLKIGDWWEITHDGKSTPMQLIWLSQPPGRTCFVNRSADRQLELTLNELAALIGRDEANPGEDRDLPLLERSEYGTIDAMYRRLVHQANRDPVTNLPNRKYLLQQVEREARLNSVNSFCVLGFDPYRLIFDQCGTQAGEMLTRDLAAMIQRSLGTKDLLAVIGEGRFTVFLPDMTIEIARDFASRLKRNLEGFRFQHGGENFSIHSFFGLTSYLPGTIEATDALRQAISACDVARTTGPNTIQVYAGSDHLIHDRETIDNWAGQISEMLSGDRLFLRCQKIASLREPDATPYYEVLLGVLDKEGTQLNPQPFVLAAERWKRAHELDIWVFSSVFDWIRKNRTDFDRTSGFSINLSAQSLSDASLLDALHRELSAGDIPCDKIAFEITETATLHSQSVAQDFMRQIRRYGCHFSLDDFGSGNASFGYLRSLRTDTLKIDGAYIKDMVDDPELQVMVKSMNEIGHSLGMKTVAEFVASPEILAMVKDFGLDYAQGYEIEKPIRIDELIQKT